jgi:hypothetical protein
MSSPEASAPPATPPSAKSKMEDVVVKKAVDDAIAHLLLYFGTFPQRLQHIAASLETEIKDGAAAKDGQHSRPLRFAKVSHVSNHRGCA